MWTTHPVYAKRSPVQVLGRRWPWLLAGAVLGALLATAVLLARPPIYEARAVVHLPGRYGPVARDAEGNISPRVLQEARDFLVLDRVRLVASAQIEQPIEFGLEGAEAFFALGRSTEAARAQELADSGGRALAEALRSVYGWDLLKVLLRRTLYLQGRGRTEPPTPLTPHLYELLEAGFLSYDPTIPVPDPAPLLSAQDVHDITLALQRMEERERARLDALFERRERTSDPAIRADIEAEIQAVKAGRTVLGRALMTLYKQGALLVQRAEPEAPPEVRPAGPTVEVESLPRWTYLLLGTGGGLLLASILALLDESCGLARHLGELLAYRELVWNLVLRDLKARYKSSFLGYLWSLVNPLLMMTVFTILFKFLLKSPIPNFPVFIIVALLPWNFCSSSVTGAVTCITAQSNLVKKVYFPREAIPIALVLANLINFLLALPAMFLIMLLLNARFQPAAALFPLIALIETIFLMGVALFLSALNVFFRDTQVITEVLLTAWFFLTPIFYRLGDIVDVQLARLVRWLNPMASLVDFYRDIFYLGGMPGWDAIVRTLVTALLVLLAGYLFFLRLSPRFGEEL
ncbi:MAG: ABC transporter permease [Chloroflexia bacterium]